MRTVDCDTCGARFALPEDIYEQKVAGRITHVRCKSCGTRVEINGAREAVPETWLVSYGDDDDRELTASEIAEALQAGEIDPETIAWREGMSEWLALADIDQFAPVCAGLAAEEPTTLRKTELDETQGSELAAATDVAAELDATSVDAAARAELAADEEGEVGSEELDATPNGAAAPAEPATDPEKGTLSASTAAAVPTGTAATGTVVLAPEPESDPEGSTPLAVRAEELADHPIPVATGAEQTPDAPQPPTESNLEGSALGPYEGVAPYVGAPHAGSKDIHSLFSVESDPPEAIQLSDSDVASAPPSDLPKGLRLRRLEVPKPPRAPVFNDVAMRIQVPSALTAVSVPEPHPTPSEVSPPPPLVEPSAAPDIPITDEQEPETPRRGVVLVRWVAALVGLAAAGTLLGLSLSPGKPEAARRTASLPTPAASHQQPEPPRPSTSSGVLARQEDPTPSARQGQSKSSNTPPSAEAATSRATPGRAASPSPTPPAAARTPTAPTPTTKPTTRPRPESQPATTAQQPEASGAAFNKAAAVAALTAAANSASACRRGSDPSGTATVIVTFAPSGRVTSANLSGPPFAGTQTGGCIASMMRRARIPSFSGQHVTVSKRVVIY